MSPAPDGIDEAWDRADPAAAARAGIRVVSMYLSRDRSKNATAALIKAYHQHGIGVLLNWEAMPGAPLQGHGQGVADATDGVAEVHTLIHGVGYAPKSRLAIPFSCDRDTNALQRHGKIHQYYAATRDIVHHAGYLNGVYGEADLCDYLHGHGLTDMEWQTYAWSNGRLSPQADFYQYSNNHHLGGGTVDWDRVIHAAQVGAWWPPNHPLNVAPGSGSKPPTAPHPAATVTLSDAQLEAIAARVWAHRIKFNGNNYTAGAWLVTGRAFARTAALAITDTKSGLLQRVARIQKKLGA